MTVPDAPALAGTQWQLVAIDTAGSTTRLTPEQQRRHTLAFREGGELTAQLDCNRGRATWTAGQPTNGAGAISFGPVASTRMLCPEPGFGDAFAAALGAARRFQRSPDGRALVIETPDIRLTFAVPD